MKLFIISALIVTPHFYYALLGMLPEWELWI